MIEVLVFLALWFACGLITYGGEFAYWQREYTMLAKDNYRRDRWQAIYSIFLGPIGLIVCLPLMRWFKHGFKWK